jgi:L-asparaginase II
MCVAVGGAGGVSGACRDRGAVMVESAAFVQVAVTSRSGFDESVHFGAVVCLGASGDIVFAAGDPGVTIYPRSANKPLQATAMVRAGLDLAPPLLALVCSSHDGTPLHVAAARAILAGAGLDEQSLANTADLPLDPGCAEQILRDGGGRLALLQNCSGKHSGMLATSVRNGWPTDPSYLRPDHPLQLSITATIDELAEEEHAHIGVDGCGAPAHAMTLVGLARAFRTVAMAAGPVYSAMTGHPAMVGGDRRDVTKLMRHVPGLVAKDGAEGVYAAALPDGRAVAVKIADGASRARSPVMLAALARLGIDTSAAAPLLVERVLGHGSSVGDVRASLP